MKFIVQGNYHNQNFINKKNCIIIFVLLYLYYHICIICIIILLSRDFLMPVVVNGHGSKVQVAIFLLNLTNLDLKTCFSAYFHNCDSVLSF